MKSLKKAGILGEIVNGTGGLVIMVIITLIIVSTLLGASLLGSDDTATVTYTNETGYVNETGYSLSGANSSTSSHVITAIWSGEQGEYNLSVLTGNASVSASGVVTNASASTYDNVTLSYTLTYSTTNMYESTSQSLSSNFTEGIGNVSTKIPTILLIAAIVVLFGALVVLVSRAKQMQLGGNNSL